MIIQFLRLGKRVCLTGVILLLAGCSPAATTMPPTNTPAAGDVILFEVIKADGSAVPFTFNDLALLPQKDILVDEKAENGPTLLAVLEKAGVSVFDIVTISGSGKSLGLARDQVDEQVILAFTQRNTVRLASPQVPRSQWIRDVNKIRVEP